MRGPNERTYAGPPEREHQLIMVEIGTKLNGCSETHLMEHQ